MRQRIYWQFFFLMAFNIVVFLITVFIYWTFLFYVGNSESNRRDSDASSTISSETGSNSPIGEPEMSLLDLYSGCGAMSTGLCIGASLSGVKLVTVSQNLKLDVYFHQLIN